MEGFLIACALIAVGLLLLGYLRVSKQKGGEVRDWLFAYRVAEDTQHEKLSGK